MSVRDSFIVALALVGLQSFVLGQNLPAPPTDTGAGAQRTAPAPALSGVIGMDAQPADEQSSEDVPQIPGSLGGPGSSLAFSSERERSNYLRGGINVGAAYNDNALLGSGSQVGNTTYSVFPNIAIEQSTSRMGWSLGYAAGLTVNQRLSNQNQGAHALHFNSDFRITPHVSLRVAEDFSLTTGIFGANVGSGLPSGTVGSDTNLITPLASQRSSTTVVEANYHYALKDIVGASGSFYTLHFSDISTGSGTLGDTRTASGTAFWLHQLFQRDWGGLSYSFNRITFDPSGETRVHTFSVTNTVSLSKTFTISAYIGPQYSDNQGVAATGANAGQTTVFSDWSIAGGVEGNWQHERTSVAAGYSRRTNGGGGLMGASRSQNVHAELRRELLPGWSATVGGSYGSNDAITLIAATNATSIQTTSVGASLERNIGRSLGLQIGYFHDFQSQSGSSAATQNFDANRNRFSVTLSYQWAKAIGR